MLSSAPWLAGLHAVHQACQFHYHPVLGQITKPWNRRFLLLCIHNGVPEIAPSKRTIIFFKMAKQISMHHAWEGKQSYSKQFLFSKTTRTNSAKLIGSLQKDSEGQ